MGTITGDKLFDYKYHWRDSALGQCMCMVMSVYTRGQCSHLEEGPRVYQPVGPPLIYCSEMGLYVDT